jgi:hypothetical protein
MHPGSKIRILQNDISLGYPSYLFLCLKLSNDVPFLFYMCTHSYVIISIQYGRRIMIGNRIQQGAIMGPIQDIVACRLKA